MLEVARMASVLEREWGAPNEVDSQLGTRRWLSPDSKTEALLTVLPFPDERPYDGLLVSLGIEDRECARQARSGVGVSGC